MFYRGSSRKGGTYIGVPGAGGPEAGNHAGNHPDHQPGSSFPHGQFPAGNVDSGTGLTRNVEVRLQERPLVGTLISASADGMGEIFPIYLGKNVIGRGEDCDIRLNEVTVSQNHAVILVRTVVDEYGNHQLSATLTDYDSDYGSNVDGLQAEYDKLTLQNGSTICIGRGYVLTIYLFNPWLQGFGRNPAFMPAEEFPRPESEKAQAAVPTGQTEAPPEPEIGPGTVSAADEYSFYGRPVAPKKRDHAQAATVSDRQDFYAGATRRNPGAAPGTVIK